MTLDRGFTSLNLVMSDEMPLFSPQETVNGWNASNYKHMQALLKETKNFGKNSFFLE